MFFKNHNVQMVIGCLKTVELKFPETLQELHYRSRIMILFVKCVAFYLVHSKVSKFSRQ